MTAPKSDGEQPVIRHNFLNTFSPQMAEDFNKSASESSTVNSNAHRVKRAVKTPSHADQFRVVCYFTNWAWHRKGIGKYMPSDIDSSLCTNIVYAFAELDADELTIKSRDPRTDVDKEFYKQVAAHKTDGAKVSLSIGGWSDSAGDKYSRLVNSPKARATFVQSVVKFLEKYGFDGLDLDWEYPRCWQGKCQLGPASDKPSFSAFVRELRAAFAPKGLLLSAAVSSNSKVIDQAYEAAILSENLDWIGVMTYAYHGMWSETTGHASPLFRRVGDKHPEHNANFSINYLINSGVDRQKLVLGMAFYGLSFTLVNATDHGLDAPITKEGEPGEYTRAKGVLGYYEICDRTAKRNWTVVQDPSGAIGPYAYKGDQWVSFDDPHMIRRKSRWIRESKLGGGMIWTLDFDDFTNACGCEPYPLLKTLNRELGRLNTTDPVCKVTLK